MMYLPSVLKPTTRKPMTLKPKMPVPVPVQDLGPVVFNERRRGRQIPPGDDIFEVDVASQDIEDYERDLDRCRRSGGN